MSEYYCYGCSRYRKGEPAYFTGGKRKTYCAVCESRFKRQSKQDEKTKLAAYGRTAKNYVEGVLPIADGQR